MHDASSLCLRVIFCFSFCAPRSHLTHDGSFYHNNIVETHDCSLHHNRDFIKDSQNHTVILYLGVPLLIFNCIFSLSLLSLNYLIVFLCLSVPLIKQYIWSWSLHKYDPNHDPIASVLLALWLLPFFFCCFFVPLNVPYCLILPCTNVLHPHPLYGNFDVPFSF